MVVFLSPQRRGGMAATSDVGHCGVTSLLKRLDVPELLLWQRPLL